MFYSDSDSGRFMCNVVNIRKYTYIVHHIIGLFMLLDIWHGGLACMMSLRDVGFWECMVQYTVQYISMGNTHSKNVIYVGYLFDMYLLDEDIILHRLIFWTFGWTSSHGSLLCRVNIHTCEYVFGDCMRMRYKPYDICFFLIYMYLKWRTVSGVSTVTLQ